MTNLPTVWDNQNYFLLSEFTICLNYFTHSSCTFFSSLFPVCNSPAFSERSLHRITEWLGLEGTPKIIKLQFPCSRQDHQPPYLILDQSWELFLWLPPTLSQPPLKLFICFSSSCCFELNFLLSIFESLYLSIPPSLYLSVPSLSQFFAGYICLYACYLPVQMSLFYST